LLNDEPRAERPPIDFLDLQILLSLEKQPFHSVYSLVEILDVKTSLVGQIFDEPKQLLEAITEFLNEIQPPEVVTVFSHWVERVRSVLENNGDYYHE
jgi:hypothetical protein